MEVKAKVKANVNVKGRLAMQNVQSWMTMIWVEMWVTKMKKVWMIGMGMLMYAAQEIAECMLVYIYYIPIGCDHHDHNICISQHHDIVWPSGMNSHS